MTSSTHGHQVGPVSATGGWTVGVDDGVGVVGVALATVLVRAVGDGAAVRVGLREGPWAVAVAVTVAVTVAVAVVVARVVVAAGVGGAGLDADGALGVGVLEAFADADADADASLDASADSDGVDLAGELGASDTVGDRVGAPVSDLDGGRTVGSSALGVSEPVGANDLVGVGSRSPSPFEPHAVRAPSMRTATAATATRMFCLRPVANPRPRGRRSSRGRLAGSFDVGRNADRPSVSGSHLSTGPAGLCASSM
jgi:hypothetical protein